MKISTYIITSITARPVGFTAILAIMSVSIFKSAVILYILPSDSHITKLILTDVHQKAQHQWRRITLNKLRLYEYWIVRGGKVCASMCCVQKAKTPDRILKNGRPSSRTRSAFSTFYILWYGLFWTGLGTVEEWLHRSSFSQKMRIGDIVLVKDIAYPRNQWPLANVVEVNIDDDGLLRRVKVKMGRKNFHPGA